MPTIYDFRRGLKIEINGEPFVIVDYDHVKPGKGAAFVRTRIKSLVTGKAPVGFKLRFAEPLRGVEFVRPALWGATESGVTHPAWVVRASSAAGKEVTASEPLLRGFQDPVHRDAPAIPARRVTLMAPPNDAIVALAIWSDNRNEMGKFFAAFQTLVIQELRLIRFQMHRT